jgi:alkylation response protein AidB-like acyl-CoA dehydrogenase
LGLVWAGIEEVGVPKALAYQNYHPASEVASGCAESVLIDLQERTPLSTTAHIPRPTESAARAEFLRALRTRGQEIERAGRLPADVVQEMVRVGLFRLAVPRAYGGDEADIHTLIAAIEDVSESDGSAGLVLTNATVWQIFATRLPLAGYREVYASGPDVVLAGSFNGRAEAVPVDNGFRIRGQWSFSSGCDNAEWLLGSCVVGSADGDPTEGAAYQPGERIAAFFPAADVVIVPNWQVSGMRGTGSNDFLASDVFVPRDRTFSMYTDASADHGGLYAAPVISVLAVVAAPVAVGICKAAIDEIRRLAVVKTPLRAQGNSKVSDRASVKLAVAEAEADRLAARGLLRTAADIIAGWEHAEAAPSLAERSELRLCASHAVRLAAAATTKAYEAGGSTSIREDSPLQRYFRDVHAMTQLTIVSAAQYEIVADVLFDRPLQNPEFL